MSQRFSRGTLTRNAWDFYEVGTAFAFAANFVIAGGVGLMIVNNGVGNSYLDVYRAECSTAIAGALYWVAAPFSAVINPQEPQTYVNSPCQLDLAGPPGLMVVFSNYSTGGSIRVRQRNDPVTFDSLELASGGPFMSLPANWGLAVILNSTGNQNISASIWYLSITDNTPPVS